MTFNKKVKTVLVSLAIVGTALCSGCGGKDPKNMSFDELIEDWTQTMSMTISEQDKMIADYIKKDPETYKVFALKGRLMPVWDEKKIRNMHLTKEQYQKLEEAIAHITEKTVPQEKIARMDQEQQLAQEINEKMKYDKDLMAVLSRGERYRNAYIEYVHKLRKDDGLETNFGMIQTNMKIIKEVLKEDGVLDK